MNVTKTVSVHVLFAAVFIVLYNFITVGSAYFPLFKCDLMTLRDFLSKIPWWLEKTYLTTNVD